MSTVNLNSVAITGNLTQDPELRELPSGTKTTELRVALNGMPNRETGDQRVSFLSVVVYGPQAENAVKFLVKGRPVAIQGRIESRSWKAEDGTNRSKVEIIANMVQFLNQRNGNGAPADTSTDAPAEAKADDGIPF